MRDADGFPFDEWEGRAEALGGEAAARQPSAGGRAADSAAGGGAEARPRVLVVKGNYTAAPLTGNDQTTADNDSKGLTGKLKRLLADRARALIAETCGDMPEAAKIAACGVHVRAGVEDVAIERHPNGYVYATGLQTCGSVWACPICSFKIRTKRATELAAAIAAHKANGGTVMLLTLTTQHSFGETLDELWTQTQDTWSYITGHSRYRRLKLQLGLGFCRTMEVMFGLNGWHPHLHVVLFSETPVDQFDNRDIWAEIIVCFHDLWVNRMRNKYNRECRSSVAVDLRPVKDDGIDGVGVYCTKAGYEVAMADGKEGRTRTSRHPFAIAYDAVETGDKADVLLFREWIKGSHDRRMWTWSKGLRRKLGLADEKTDEELAAEADETIEQVCIVSRKLWRKIATTRIGLRAEVLAALDTSGGGVATAIELLWSHGLQVAIEPRGSSPPRLRLADEPRRIWSTDLRNAQANRIHQTNQ